MSSEQNLDRHNLRSKSQDASFNLLFNQMKGFFLNDAVTYAVCEKCDRLNRVAFDFPFGKSPVCGKCKSTLSLHKGVSDLNPASLATLLRKSPLPVVVDFWAPWCGPCRAFAPTFIETAERLKERVVFGKIDTQAHPNAGQTFGIRGIPTLIVFLNGREVSRTSGALPSDEFLKWVTMGTGIAR